MTKLFNKFRRDEKGVTLVEYGIALILAISVGGVLLGGLGVAVNGQLGEAEACMTSTTC